MLDGPGRVGGNPSVHPLNGGAPKTFKFTLQSVLEKSRLKGNFTLEITFGLKGITHYVTNIFNVSGKISGSPADIEELFEKGSKDKEGPLFVTLEDRDYFRLMIRFSRDKVGDSLVFSANDLQTKETKFEISVVDYKSIGMPDPLAEEPVPLITFGPVEINI